MGADHSALLMGLLAVLTFASVNVVQGCGINIVNGCGYQVTTCAQSSNGPISQFQLGAGGQQYLDFGSGCQWPAGAIWASVNGQCAASGSSSAANDRNLADLAEFTIGSSGTDFYDLSNVNAYTIGLSIAVTYAIGGGQTNFGTTRCGTITCAISDIRSLCQGNNRLVTLSSGALTCVNTDGTNGIGPTSNTQLFKAACPDAYSYNYDDSTSTFTCGNGSDYEVTLCPGGITSAVNETRMDPDH